MKAGYKVFYVSIIITKQSKHISKIGRVISKVVIRILGEGRDEWLFLKKKKEKISILKKILASIGTPSSGSAIDCLLLPQAAPPQTLTPIPHPKNRHWVWSALTRASEGGGARSMRLPCRQSASPAPHSGFSLLWAASWAAADAAEGKPSKGTSETGPPWPGQHRDPFECPWLVLTTPGPLADMLSPGHRP